MATVYGVNKTKYKNAIGENLVNSGVNKGQVCYMYDSYEASSLAAASLIEVCDLIPRGAVVTKITILTDNLGGSATIDIGDALDDDRYGAAVDISGQATTYVYPEAAAAASIANYGYEIVDTGTASTSSNQLKLLVNTSAVTGTIKVGVEYAV
ncbi:MAG: hypothetical protein U9O94_10695 [Nanoarchaeota archaeon]|nr:hypothetical protein [Nanoarchaeota archaeon]